MEEHHRKVFKIAVLDDEPLWCASIQELLERDERLSVVGTAMTQTAAVKLAERFQPDIFLVDMKLKSKTNSGITATKAILDASPQTQVVILTTSEMEEDVNNAVSIGAVKYILKDNMHNMMPEVTNLLSEGFNPDRIIANNFAKLRKELVLSELTREEFTLMKALTDGIPRAKLGTYLNKSEPTIKSQIRGILIKFNVSTTEEALMKVRSGGSFPSPKRNKPNKCED